MYFEDIIRDLYPNVKAEDYYLLEGNNCDYSFNKVNALSKVLGKNAEIIAEEIFEKLKLIPFITVEMKNNTMFINLTQDKLDQDINTLFQFVLSNSQLPKIDRKKKRVLIDMISPNIAKEMHVGHLRSAIIGESLSRLYEYLGDDVIRRNHLGDWGTQFGMLIAYIKNNNILEYNIEDLTKMYKEAKKCFDNSADFKFQSRNETFLLQQGDSVNRTLWEKIVNISMIEFDKIFNALDAHAEIKGESFYQPYMTQLVKEVPLIDHEGMKVIFSQGSHLIMIKKDGAFTYDTSDLAALKYRLEIEKVDKILYVVDISQQLHFETLFSVANDLNFIESQELQYVGFGLVLGSDNKKLKTRSGETIKLSGLLNEAFNSAFEFSKETEIARKISLNCIKYADLSCPRLSNYKYDPKKMMNTKGNTAVYLMYAMARCKSILRKVDFNNLTNYEIKIDSKESRSLIFSILKYPEVLTKSYNTCSPHYICNYLYNLVITLTKFYETNRCLEIKNGEIIFVHEHRICLIHLTTVLIDQLFFLIGLENIEQI